MADGQGEGKGARTLREPTDNERALLADVVRTVDALRSQFGEPPCADATEALMQCGVWLVNTVRIQREVEGRIAVAEREGRALDS